MPIHLVSGSCSWSDVTNTIQGGCQTLIGFHSALILPPQESFHVDSNIKSREVTCCICTLLLRTQSKIESHSQWFLRMLSTWMSSSNLKHDLGCHFGKLYDELIDMCTPSQLTTGHTSLVVVHPALFCMMTIWEHSPGTFSFDGWNAIAVKVLSCSKELYPRIRTVCHTCVDIGKRSFPDYWIEQSLGDQILNLKQPGESSIHFQLPPDFHSLTRVVATHPGRSNWCYMWTAHRFPLHCAMHALSKSQSNSAD